MSHDSTQRTLPLSLDGRTATLPLEPSRQAIVELLAQLLIAAMGAAPRSKAHNSGRDEDA